jgi:hypothetical protein
MDSMLGNFKVAMCGWGGRRTFFSGKSATKLSLCETYFPQRGFIEPVSKFSLGNFSMRGWFFANRACIFAPLFERAIFALFLKILGLVAQSVEHPDFIGRFIGPRSVEMPK